MVLVDSIVHACIKVYETIPKTGKPNSKEWTVISALVAVFNDKEIKVISLGTGSKCIGKSSMSSKGDVLNDSHAEVIARRAFLKYLYLEIIKLNKKNSSDIFYRKDNNTINVKGSVKFYFVTSMSPCGDASIMPKNHFSNNDIELLGDCLENSTFLVLKNSLKRKYSENEIISKKIKTEKMESNERAEDIYRTGAKCLFNSPIQDQHLPGVFFHNIGAVRTKPGRGDPTLSLSCSDKIAKWNSVGWQGALLSLFIKSPIYVDGIICGGNTPFCKQSFDRAVNERIKKDTFISIQQSNVTFPNIKAKEKRPCPSSIIWCEADSEKPEVSINGRKQGVTKKNLTKKIARTSICKKEFLILFEKVINTFLNKEEFLQELCNYFGVTSLKDIGYRELKLSAQEYQKNWEITKKNCFKVWANKPVDLLNFNLREEV